MSLTQELLKELFDYRDGVLINRFTRGPRAVKGSNAGNINPSNGYWRVTIGGKTYQLSRVIWFWHHGDLDASKVIDHIDGNPQNNKIENLRLCTQQQNEWNKAAKGCTFEKGKWRARYKHNGKSHHIGLYETQEEAQAAYLSVVKLIRPDYSQRKCV